jgi:hypothetical protein
VGSSEASIKHLAPYVFRVVISNNRIVKVEDHKVFFRYKKRTKLADQLCDQFDFFDLRGKKQRSGCLKALRELEQKGQFVLPMPCHIPGKVRPRRLAEPVPEPLECFLLTTIDIKSIDDALNCVKWYC